LILALDGTHILHVFDGRIEAVIFDILNPVATATSGRGTVHCDRNTLCFFRRARCKEEGGEGKSGN